MSNVLFDRLTLKVTGSNNPPLPFEVSIENISPENLTKSLSYLEDEVKLSEEGLPIYLLPQKPLVESIGRKVKVESTETTSEPVMNTVTKKVPLLDGNLRHIQYEVTNEVITPAVYDDEGELVTDEKVEQVKTGVFNKCYTTKLVEEQKKDKSGKLIYLKEEIVMEEVTTELPAIEITEDDERYSEELSKVLEPIEKSRTVSYDEEPSEFTYQEVAMNKYLGIVNGSQMDGVLVETFTTDNLDTEYENHSGNSGFGFVSLLPKGKVKTVQYELSSPKDTFNLLELDADEGIEIRYGNRPVTGELVLSSPTDKINFIIVNKTDEPRDIRSFAVGY